MFIERNARFTIYFGDAAQSVSLDEIALQQTTPPLQNISQQAKANQIAFLRQEHGVQGKIIELTAQLSKVSGIPIWHEIHRGRFSFHLKTLLRYVEKFPQLKLIADFVNIKFCFVYKNNFRLSAL